LIMILLKTGKAIHVRIQWDSDRACIRALLHSI